MSLASIIGLGYSGYAILGGVPIPLLPSSTPEDEHLIKSEGAFNSNPSKNMGHLPARQRRSLNISFQTIITPKTLALLAPLTYGWRASELLMDNLAEVEFKYIIGTGEGFHGTGHVDDVTISAEVDSFVLMNINMTSWVWDEVGGETPLTRYGTQALGVPPLGPLFDHGYKPIAFWQGAVKNNVIDQAAIPTRYSLRFANNWTYQTFLGGYPSPPNPGLITAGALDTSLSITWLAQRKDRPRNSGWFKIYIGGNDPANGNALSIINLDRMVREPRAFEGGGAPNTPIHWTATYFGQGNAPY